MVDKLSLIQAHIRVLPFPPSVVHPAQFIHLIWKLSNLASNINHKKIHEHELRWFSQQSNNLRGKRQDLVIGFDPKFIILSISRSFLTCTGK
jgi:hypothetical protein